MTFVLNTIQGICKKHDSYSVRMMKRGNVWFVVSIMGLKRQIHAKIRPILANLNNSVNRFVRVFHDFLAVRLSELRIFKFLAPGF